MLRSNNNQESEDEELEYKPKKNYIEISEEIDRLGDEYLENKEKFSKLYNNRYEKLEQSIKDSYDKIIELKKTNRK